MTSQEEWSQQADKALIHSNPSLTYLEGISDFKAALKARLEEISRDEESCGNSQHYLNGLDRAIREIDEVTPLK
jgi:hypothetical protein